MNFWAGKKVLVTGGAGFIGANLCEKLVSLEAETVVVDNLERGKIENLENIKNKINFIKGDLRENDFVKKLFEDSFDVVIHLASKVGGIGYYTSQPGTVISENILIDNNVINGVINSSPEYFLYASSAHVYPKELQTTPDTSPINENQCYPANPELSYGWAKLIAEQEILFNLEEKRLKSKVSIPRLIGAYGKYQDLDLEKGSAIPVFCRRAVEYPNLSPFIIWGTGNETRSFCFVEDIVEGILLSIEKSEILGLVGPFNLGTDEVVTINEILKIIIKISQKDIKIENDLSKKTTIWGQNFDIKLSQNLLDSWKAKTNLETGLKITYDYIAKYLEKNK